jgi:hypothetical protein
MIGGYLVPPAASGAAAEEKTSVPYEETKGPKVRAERIAELLAIARDETLAKDKPEAVKKAMLALGEMKALEAIPVLIEKLTWRGPESPRMQHVGEMFPASDALVKMGPIVLPYVADAIALRPRDPRINDPDFLWEHREAFSFDCAAHHVLVSLLGRVTKTNEYLATRIALYEQGVKNLRGYFRKDPCVKVEEPDPPPKKP